MKYLDLYKKEIKENKIVVCKKIKKAIKRIEYLKNKYYFNQDLANYGIEFIERFCKHYESPFAGADFKLSLWQKVMLESLYGIIDKESNRVIKELFIVVARKNGKSTLASAMSLEMLIAEGEEGAQVYSVANKLDQAKIIYKACYEMVKKSPELTKLVIPRRAQLEFGSSVLKPLASDSSSLDGLNPYLAIYDEGHATKTLDLYEVIKSAFGTRDNYLMMNITTAGYVREGLYDYLYKLSEQILDDLIEDDSFMPFIFELDKDDDYTDEINWQKANPNIGISLSVEAIRSDLIRANNDAKKKNELLAKRFNLPQATSSAYFELEDIRNDEIFNNEDIKGKYCLIGLDLSKTSDLTSISFYIPIGKGNETKIYLKQIYMLPDFNIAKKQSEDKKPYLAWKEEGLLHLSKGYMIDPDYLMETITSFIDENDLYPYALCVDRWNIDRIENKVNNLGLTMFKVAQGYQTLSPAMLDAEAQIKEKRLIHNNNPLLVWNFVNVGIEQDVNGNIRPIKGNGGANKIDGFMSYVNCVAIHNNSEVKEFFEAYQGGD